MRPIDRVHTYFVEKRLMLKHSDGLTIAYIRFDKLSPDKHFSREENFVVFLTVEYADIFANAIECENLFLHLPKL